MGKDNRPRRVGCSLLSFLIASAVGGCDRNSSPQRDASLPSSAATETAQPLPTESAAVTQSAAPPSVTPLALSTSVSDVWTTTLHPATLLPPTPVASISATVAIATQPPTPPPAAPVSSPSAPLASTLAGVHFAGEARAAKVFGRDGLEGWAVELAYARGPGSEDPRDVARRMRDRRTRGFRPILRIDYVQRQTVPPALHTTADMAPAVATDVAWLREESLSAITDFAAETVSLSEGALQHVIVGNEPNIDADGSAPDRLTECASARTDCAPAAYARVYRAMRAALAPLGAATLVAGVSPGTAAHPARWMGGPEYLATLLAELSPDEVDGIALHAYGLEADPVPGLPTDRLAYFQSLVNAQLAAIDAAGHAATPLYLSEMNTYADPDAPFIRDAFAWLDQLNAQRQGDIRAAVWFVWDSAGAWQDYALSGAPEDVRATFAEAAQAYPPGR